MVYGLLTHAAAFVAGVVIGVAGRFLADWLTDIRRRRAANRQGRKQFEEMRGQMPALIEEMKQDLTGEDNRQTREFFVLKKGWVLNAQSPHFRYYYEDHPHLDEHVQIMENHGYVIDVTPGNTPKYRMTEELVRLILNS